MKKDLIERTLLGFVLGIVIIFGILQYQTNGILVNKIDALDYQIKSSEKITDYTVKGIEKDLDDNYKDLIRKIEQVPKLEKAKKLSLEAKLKQINVFITNKTIGATGSGVTLKYKDKFYILSAGHMAENKDDKIFLSENGQEICELEIVKHSYDGKLTSFNSNDLILLTPKDKNIVPQIYVELSNIEPETSNALYIVGNPLGFEDVLSDARCIMYQGKFMYVIGTSYFGNSGGGIYNQEGKLVGIMSHLIPIQPFDDVPPYLIHGVVRLDIILEFLRGVN